MLKDVTPRCYLRNPDALNVKNLLTLESRKDHYLPRSQIYFENADQAIFNKNV